MDVTRTLAGTRYLIEQERRGAYPGGRARAVERKRIVTRHSRPASLERSAHGGVTESWQIYRSSFFWHMQLRRWKYLLGFPMKALLSLAAWMHSME